MLTVPESLEGWCLLHQMFRVSWPSLVQASNDERAELAEVLDECRSFAMFGGVRFAA